MIVIGLLFDPLRILGARMPRGTILFQHHLADLCLGGLGRGGHLRSQLDRHRLSHVRRLL
jgi:hypothetical protein